MIPKDKNILSAKDLKSEELGYELNDDELDMASGGAINCFVINDLTQPKSDDNDLLQTLNNTGFT